MSSSFLQAYHSQIQIMMTCSRTDAAGQFFGSLERQRNSQKRQREVSSERDSMKRDFSSVFGNGDTSQVCLPVRQVLALHFQRLQNETAAGFKVENSKQEADPADERGRKKLKKTDRTEGADLMESKRDNSSSLGSLVDLSLDHLSVRNGPKEG
ncbi:hypothetical protein AOLI_G00191480 [Acnodon oligacanthus]